MLDARLHDRLGDRLCAIDRPLDRPNDRPHDRHRLMLVPHGHVLQCRADQPQLEKIQSFSRRFPEDFLQKRQEDVAGEVGKTLGADVSKNTACKDVWEMKILEQSTNRSCLLVGSKEEEVWVM